MIIVTIELYHCSLKTAMDKVQVMSLSNRTWIINIYISSNFHVLKIVFFSCFLLVSYKIIFSSLVEKHVELVLWF